MKRKGNRIQCLEGCGRWVLVGKPICRKCKRSNKIKLAKQELTPRQERRKRLAL
ncbi:hypothetical protein LCGC14_1189610 [marine sediment metagenome]|uniref:Uncharacterized protein n=1 Tax=marine sediment metagenome TaxID=412755 RepID=A0A0F9P2J0_9ZZZZ